MPKAARRAAFFISALIGGAPGGMNLGTGTRSYQ